MLHVLTTQVNNTHPMFSYFEDLCGAANNLKNATALPVMNAAGKQPTEAGDRYKMPAQGKSFLSYPFWNHCLGQLTTRTSFAASCPARQLRLSSKTASRR